MSLPFVASRDHDAIVIRYPEMTAGDEYWILLRSDAHHDSPECDTALEKKHLEQAVERDAAILDFGDLHDVMQSRHDRRRSRKGVKAAHAAENGYLNNVISDATAFYRPYAMNWVMMGRGNHESAILTHNEFDLPSALATTLNVDTGSNILVGAYSGWVRLMFSTYGVHCSKWLYYTHGSGGASPVTRGVIKSARRAVYLPDADIVVSGHSHNAWVVPIPRKRISRGNVAYEDEALHIQIPTYKRAGEWEDEREMNPKPRGAYWLKLWAKSEAKAVDFDVIRAK